MLEQTTNDEEEENLRSPRDGSVLKDLETPDDDDEEPKCCICVNLQVGIKVLAYMMMLMSIVSIIHLSGKFNSELSGAPELEKQMWLMALQLL